MLDTNYRMTSTLLKCYRYAANFGKVEGAYYFGLVRACVCPSVQNLLRYSFEISYMESSSKTN